MLAWGISNKYFAILSMAVWKMKIPDFSVGSFVSVNRYVIWNRFSYWIYKVGGDRFFSIRFPYGGYIPQLVILIHSCVAYISISLWQIMFIFQNYQNQVLNSATYNLFQRYMSWRFNELHKIIIPRVLSTCANR